MSISFPGLRTALLGAVALTLTVAAPAAHADGLGLPGISCPDEQLSQPFANWGDPASYALVPGGAFESGDTPWDLSGDAQVVSGNEPWQVHGATDDQSLLLPPGSSATSPETCVALTTPTLRFFAQSIGGSPQSSLSVNVLIEPLPGVVDSVPIGSVTASGEWEPTPPFLLGVNVLALLSSNFRQAAFQFTPVGDAAWQIDDVYIDPWSKG